MEFYLEDEPDLKALVEEWYVMRDRREQIVQAIYQLPDVPINRICYLLGLNEKDCKRFLYTGKSGSFVARDHKII